MKILLKVLFVIFILSGCQKKSNDLNYEKKVMSEIFPNLMDSLWQRVVFDYGYKWKINDLRKVKGDSSQIIVVVKDAIQKFDRDKRPTLLKHFKSIRLPKKSEFDNIEYKFDSIIYKPNKPFRMMCYSDYIVKKHAIQGPNKFLFVDIMGDFYFSRIQFDKYKKFGALSCTYAMDRRISEFLVFIKYSNGEWKIDSIGPKDRLKIKI